MSKINISGKDKVKLLRALWENSKPAYFFTMSGMNPPDWDETKAQKAVKGHIDYFQGRLIKTDLSQDEVDPNMYDKDYGTGTFNKIVENL